MKIWMALKSGLLFVLTGLCITACGSGENTATGQMLITAFELKKLALSRCREEIKKVVGTNDMRLQHRRRKGRIW